MTGKVVFGVMVLLCVAVYAVGIVGLVATPGSNQIPTPGWALIWGVVAMFSTLGFFILGFLKAASVSD